MLLHPCADKNKTAPVCLHTGAVRWVGAGGFEQAPLTSAYARAYRISSIQAIFSRPISSHFPVRARFFAFERVTKWVIFHRSAYTPPVSLTQPSRQLHHGHQQRGYTICDCEFAVRFHSGTNVAGYDPEKYLKQYRDAGSARNAMRRIDYAANRERINAQKRAAYAVRKGSTNGNDDAKITAVKDAMTKQVLALPESSQSILRAYTGFTATRVNYAIRNGTITPQVRETIAALDAVFSRSWPSKESYRTRITDYRSWTRYFSYLYFYEF